MNRTVCMAGVAAVLLFGACFYLLRTGSDPVDSAGGDGLSGEVGSRGDSGAARAGSSAIGVRPGGRAPGAMGVEREEEGEKIAATPSGVGLDSRGSGRRARRGGDTGTGGGETSTDAAKGAGRDGKGPAWEGSTGLLAGGQLSQALADALESEDLGPLQGLLISGLTEDGTRFTADDMPGLFDALVEVDDFGLEKLILTHLERTDALPEEKVNGYLDYLQSAKRPHHADDVFQQLVKMGGDASFDGLSEMVRDPSMERYRSRAAQALGDLQDPRAVPLLDRALYAVGDPRMARPYVDALGRLGGVEAYASMVGYISREGNEAAISSIYRIRDQELAPYLAESLNARSSDAYQKAALLKLRTMSDPRTLNDLSRFLDRTEGPRQREAIEAVGRIYDPAAIRVLENFARNQSDAKLAAQALKAASRVRSRLDRPPSDRTQGKPDRERSSARSA